MGVMEQTRKKEDFTEKDLQALYSDGYGPDKLYNSGQFNALTRNLSTGKLMKDSHHCERCGAGMSRKCFDRMHYAFCPTWTTQWVKVGGASKKQRIRCGERFATHSGGCGKHPKVQGYNKALHDAADGKKVFLDSFADPDPEAVETDVPENGNNGAEEDALWELIEEKLAKGEAIDPNFAVNYWKGKKQEQTFTYKDKRNRNGRAAHGGQLQTLSEEEATEAQDNLPAIRKLGNKKKMKPTHLTLSLGGYVATNEEPVTPRRSFAPRRAKPKIPMESPRRQDSRVDEDVAPKNVRDRIFDRINISRKMDSKNGKKRK